jgi:hypothetical protein
MPLDSGDNGRRQRSLNVLANVLEPCSYNSITGFYRDGRCATGPEDVGSHTVARRCSSGCHFRWRVLAIWPSRTIAYDCDGARRRLPHRRARRPLQGDGMGADLGAGASQVMAQHGVVNKVVADNTLLAEAKAFAERVAKGPTKAHAAHRALLHIWATGRVPAADEAMFDIALPLFESEDVKLALPASVKAFLAGEARPAFAFRGR